MEFLEKEYRKQIQQIDVFSPYKRDVFYMLQKEIESSNICIAGLRQVGKTTLMLQLANWYFKTKLKINIDKKIITNILSEDEKIFYTNIKSIQKINSNHIWEELLQEISNKKYKLIVLDEIQEINEWISFLQKAISLNKEARFIVSGSNITSLTQEIMITKIKVFFVKPLLFNEYKQIWNDTNIDNYLRFGSYPKNKNYLDAFIQYKELVKNNIIDKFITENIKRNVDESKFFSLLSNINNYVGNEINTSKLKSKNHSKKQTASTYLNIMKNEKLIHFVPKFGDKKNLRKNKIYFEDKSLIYYFNKFENLNNNLIGSLVENVVFNYLNYKFVNNNLLDEIFYFRNHNGHEIDFVLPKKKLLIECKYHKKIDINKVSHRFLETCNSFKSFKDYKKIIITSNTDIELQGIKFISLKKILEEKFEW